MKTVEIFSLNNQSWERFFELRKTLLHRYYPNASSRLHDMDLEEFRTTSLASVETLDAREYVFFRDNTQEIPLGWMRCFSGNEDLVFQQDALLDEIPPEMTKQVAKLLLSYMDERPFRQVITSCKDKRLVSAVRRMQPQSEAALLIMKLANGKENRQLAAEWAAKAPLFEDQFRFRFEQELPEDLIDQYVDLHDRLLKDMPMTGGPVQYNSWSGEGIRRLIKFNRENQQSSYYYFVENTAGELVGLSEIVVRHRTMRIAQGMTGLLLPYRTLGLAKVLKGLMLSYIYQNHPNYDSIQTTTSPLNQAMQHINSELGFEVEGKMYEYIFRRQDLEKLVARTLPDQ